MLETAASILVLAIAGVILVPLIAFVVLIIYAIFFLRG